jgi:hypothetical protein
MSPHTRGRRALALNRLNYAIKSAGDETKAGFDTKMLAVLLSDDNTAIASELTLDDFGGRSDALGG